MHRTAAIGLASALILGAPAALAQEAADQPATASAETLPDGMTLVQKHVEAIGGDAGLKLQALEFVGTFEIQAMGIGGDLAIYEKAPSNRLITIELTGFGSIVQGTNGNVAWANMQPGQPPQILTEEQAAEAIGRADFYERWDAERSAKSAVTTGTEDIDGVTCYRVEIESPTGEREIAFFDAETGLKRRTVGLSDEGLTRITTTYSDYRTVEGLLFPFVLDIVNPQATQKITIAEVKIDPELASDRFAPPADF